MCNINVDRIIDLMNEVEKALFRLKELGNINKKELFSDFKNLDAS